MGTFYNTKTVRDGLVLHLDAANIKSYPGTGTTWYDLSNTKSNVINTGATFTTINGSKTWRFTAAGQYFYGSLNVAQSPSTDLTIETWIYPEAEVISGDRGTLLLLSGTNGAYMSWNKSTQQMSNYWYGHTTEGYWETGSAVNRNTWNRFGCVWNYNSGVAYQWTNNIKTTTGTTFGNAYTGGNINIGQELTSRQFSGGIAMMLVYNRALSDLEMQQNYEAMRGRYNI